MNIEIRRVKVTDSHWHAAVEAEMRQENRCQTCIFAQAIQSLILPEIYYMVCLGYTVFIRNRNTKNCERINIQHSSEINKIIDMFDDRRWKQRQLPVEVDFYAPNWALKGK